MWLADNLRKAREALIRERIGNDENILRLDGDGAKCSIAASIANRLGHVRFQNLPIEINQRDVGERKAEARLRKSRDTIEGLFRTAVYDLEICKSCNALLLMSRSVSDHKITAMEHLAALPLASCRQHGQKGDEYRRNDLRFGSISAAEKKARER